MKHLIPCLTLAASLAAGPAAMAASAALAAPIHQFIDAFDKGDMKTAAAAYEPSGVVIIDEVAPHLWRGPKAFETWVADLAADSRSQGLSDEHVALGPASREEVTRARAYVIVPAVYTFRKAGVAMREAAQMTFVLRRGPGGWKIAAWTFTGPGATPAGR